MSPLLTDASRPHVLVVDDQPDTERSSIALWNLKSRVEVLHPQDLTLPKLKAADLVLVDFRLEDWQERENLGPVISLQPINGLALSAVLRVHAEQHSDTPTAFALRSGHLGDISGQFPPETRVHVLAKRLNLEWVFSKASGGTSAESWRVDSLASAVRRLPTVWPDGNQETGRDLVETFLAIPDEGWAGQAWEDINICRPPIHEPFQQPPHALAFLRWLSQSILPYPCFLLDTYSLALRLRITHQSLVDALLAGLKQPFNSFLYKGGLQDFSGPRWWRAGLEDFLWDVTGGDSFDQEKLRNVLSQRYNVELVRTESESPVVCVDEDYRIIHESVDIEDAVRIQPDDWPSYADQAWTTKERAREIPKLKSLVMEQDRDRL